MAILDFSFNQIGQAGIFSILYLRTDNTLAEVLVPGYLNGLVHSQHIPISELDVAWVVIQPNPTTTQVGSFNILKVGDNWSFVLPPSSGGVVLPTTPNHIATYVNADGILSQDPVMAILGGGLQAASNIQTSAGNIIATTGNMIAAGNITSTAGSVQATAGNMSASGTITAGGNITSTAGSITAQVNITATSGNITAGGDLFTSLGGIIAGLSSGAQGILTLFSPTANNGKLIVQGNNAGGNFTTTVTNGTMAQSTTYTMGDIGAATGGIAVATAPIRIKSVVNAAVAGGSSTNTITDAFCTSTSNVQGIFPASTNLVTIVKITPGNGSFTVLSTADPGVSTFNYTIIK